MRSRLLNPSMYEQLLEAPDVMAAVAVLQSTDYRSDIESGLLYRPGILGVEEGLRRHQSRLFRKVRAVSLGDAKTLVDLLFGRWDVQNIKTVIRGRRIGAGLLEIMEDVVPAGILSESDLEQLASQPDVRNVVDLLATWGNPYSRPLTEASPEYHRGQDLTGLEMALDRFYYSWALQRSASLPKAFDARLVRDMIRLQIDVANLVTLLKIAGVETDSPQLLFLEGGKEIPLARLTQLHELGGVEEMIAALKDTRYGRILEDEREVYRETGELFRLERVMENEVFRSASRLFISHPLSIAIVVGYIWSMFNEVVNLRIIMRGRETGAHKEEIRAELLVA